MRHDQELEQTFRVDPDQNVLAVVKTRHRTRRRHPGHAPQTRSSPLKMTCGDCPSAATWYLEAVGVIRDGREVGATLAEFGGWA